MRKAVYNMMNWWLDKGIDGFRIDAISHIKKEEGLPDGYNPNNLEYCPSIERHMNVDGIHEYLKDIKENTFDKYDIMTVGEANGVSADDAYYWVSEKEGKFNMVFQFEHLRLWNDKVDTKVDLVEFKRVLSKWQNALYNNGWNALFIENHDIPRVVSTLGNDKKYLYESATCLGLMYFMQQGTPFIYQGQEIGMTNIKFNNIEEYDDLMTKNNYYIGLEKGKSHEELMKRVWQLSRDNSRTPMQWNSSENGGFTRGKPWIGVNENYKNINVEFQLKDENSVLSFYKNMIKVRKENKVLVYGKYNLILADHEKIYAYERILDDDKFIVITNLSDDEVEYSYDFAELKFDNLIISNYFVKKHDIKTIISLKPWEARMYKL